MYVRSLIYRGSSSKDLQLLLEDWLGSGKLSLSACRDPSALKESLKKIHLCCTNSPKTRFHNPVILKFLSTRLKVHRLLTVVPESEKGFVKGEKSHSHCQTSRFIDDILVSECLTPGNLPRACFHPSFSWLQFLSLKIFRKYLAHFLDISRYAKESVFQNCQGDSPLGKCSSRNSLQSLPSVDVSSRLELSMNCLRCLFHIHLDLSNRSLKSLAGISIL